MSVKKQNFFQFCNKIKKKKKKNNNDKNNITSKEKVKTEKVKLLRQTKKQQSNRLK